MAYVSPSGAFSSAIQDALLARDELQLKHAQLDIQEKQLARETAKDLADQQARQAEDAQSKRESETKEVTDELKNYTKGDYLPPELLKKAKALNISIPSMADPEAAASTTGASALGTGAPLGATQKPVAIRFAGSPAERKLDEDTQAALSFANTLPAGSPERAGLEYEAKTGFRRTAPAGMFGRQTMTPETSLVVKDAHGQALPGVVSIQNGVALLNGQPLPPGAHAEKGVDQSVQAARDAARDDRETAQWNTAHEKATTEMDKWSQPIQSQVIALDQAKSAIDARTPESDSIVAPLVIKGTISGEGSGFRMTRAEIEQVMKGSVWDSLQTRLQQWDTDHSKALKLDDAQRAGLHRLAQTMLEKANSRTKAIAKARDDARNAKTAKDIDAVRDKLYGTLFTVDTEAAPATKAVYYDAQGNPITGK